MASLLTTLCAAIFASLVTWVTSAFAYAPSARIYSIRDPREVSQFIPKTGGASGRIIKSPTSIDDKPPPPVEIPLPACSATAFSQIPEHPRLFLGRIQATKSPNECAPANTPYTLALFEMDWSSLKLSLVRPLLYMPTNLPGGARIGSAYDPYIVKYAARLWLAFECAGPQLKRHVSICTAQIDERTLTIIPSSLTIAIGGKMDRRKNFLLSASVPKLLVSKGQLFLYWTVASQDFRSRTFNALTQRGAAMDVSSGKVCAANSRRQTIDTDDPLHSVAMTSDSSVVGDVYDIIGKKDGSIVALATSGEVKDKGGGICVDPSGNGAKCYFPKVVRSPHQLSPLGFSARNDVNIPVGIDAPATYVRLIKDPNGRFAILARTFGKFGSPNGLGVWYPGHRLSELLGN